MGAQRATTSWCGHPAVPDGWLCPTCGRPVRFDELAVVGPVGDRSANSTVYRCVDPAGTSFAVKHAAPDAYDPLAIVTEAKVQSRLDHENVVKVVHVDEPRSFVVMEFVEGGSLAELIAHHPDESRHHAHEIVLGLARGVEHAHRRQVMHRDLKPVNILLLDERGRFVPKLADFGSAAIVETDEVTIKGSFNYIAPEAFTHGPFRYAADVFSLGVVAYEVLTGGRPFDSEGWNRAFTLRRERRYLPAGARVPDAPSDLLTVIDRMLEPDQSARIAIAEVAATLDGRG